MTVRYFRKNPIIIQAVQYDGTNWGDLVGFAGDAVKPTNSPNFGMVWDKLHQTWINFQVDDWIVKGTEGEFYPHSNDNWDKVYTEVEEPYWNDR